MAITTYVGAGTTPVVTGAQTGTGTTSVSPDLPGSLSVGDLLVLCVGTKPDTATINTPTGWTLPTNGQLAGGGGTTGADTGPSNAALFTAVYDGAMSAPTVSITSGNSSWAQIFAFHSSLKVPQWYTAAANGADITTGAAWSVTGNVDPGFVAGDHVICHSAIPTDVSTPSQFSAEAISAAGVSFATMTELSEPETDLGNQEAGFVARTTVNSGESTAAPVYTATVGGTTTNVRGVTIFLRIRSGRPGNLLLPRDEDFEPTVNEGWITNSGTRALDATQFFSGSNSMKITATSSSDIGPITATVTQVAFTAGQQYDFYIHLFNTDATVTSVRWTCDWYTSGSVFISTGLGKVQDPPPTSTWTCISETLVAPATTAFGQLYLTIAHSGTTTVVFVDNAWVGFSLLRYRNPQIIQAQSLTRASFW